MLVSIAAIALLSCSSEVTSTGRSGTVLELGTWGGDSAAMVVGDTAVHLHIACTYGDVSGRIALDANGQFDVAGSFQLRAYPVTVGPMVPARFVGRVDGKTAVVTVTVDDTVLHKTVTRGPVTVKLGVDPRLGPCPICRRPVHTMGWTAGISRFASRFRPRP